MEPHELKDALLDFLKHNVLSVVLFSIGLIALSYGLIVIFFPQFQQEHIIFEPAKQENTTAQEKKIIVDVEGAVLKPGVYSIPVDARIQDALIVAGGFADNADRKQIAHTLNLASKMIDGTKIYIPFFGETQVLSAEGEQGESLQAVINVNTASAAQLDSLPGIGEVTAQKIIKNRPYQSINEMITKKAVSSRVFSQIEKQITVN